ncbi:MAG: zinc-binding alcohol dehydrogenase family protein [Cytophagales bacterium]|jgi:hypothetical protein|nr:zinc-binding alcohol dehydrogenase family protein [Cytophagales bacterium]
MRTLVLQEPGRFAYIDTEINPSLQPGEALVRVHRTGICGTDLHAYTGKQPFFSYPRILGHELGVEVVETGAAVSRVNKGDFCAVEPYLNCGRCIACRRGATNCCVDMQVLGVHTDGGLREYLKLPADKLHPSRRLRLEQLALVETLGIGAHAVQRAQLTAADTVLVIGAGPIGLSVLAFAQLAGAAVAVMDQNDHRLAFCREQMGVVHTINSRTEDPAARFGQIFGDLPTVVLDATGNAASMARTFELSAHSGKIVFVGLFQGDMSFHDPLFHRKELTLLASRNATATDFRRIIRLMEDGRLNTDPWITHRVGFGEVAERFPDWLQPETQVVKAMVEM